jgi:hypothetical protein
LLFRVRLWEVASISDRNTRQDAFSGDAYIQERRVQASMRKDELQKIGAGLYQDEKGAVYCDIQEFLTFHKLPDTPETRRAVWEEIERQFESKVRELLGE